MALFLPDPGPLHDMLPPIGDDIRDTICVPFLEKGKRPTTEMLKHFGPVLVYKSKMETMIRFLIANNEWYQAGGVCYSDDNMAVLFSQSV